MGARFKVVFLIVVMSSQSLVSHNSFIDYFFTPFSLQKTTRTSMYLVVLGLCSWIWYKAPLIRRQKFIDFLNEHNQFYLLFRSKGEYQQQKTTVEEWLAGCRCKGLSVLAIYYPLDYMLAFIFGDSKEKVASIKNLNYTMQNSGVGPLSSLELNQRVQELDIKDKKLVEEKNKKSRGKKLKAYCYKFQNIFPYVWVEKFTKEAQ